MLVDYKSKWPFVLVSSECADEKPPDKLTGSRFPGRYNNGLGLPSPVIARAFFGGVGPWLVMAIRTPACIFTNPTLIELRQEISQYHWLRGAVTSFSALARSVLQS
ncbi:hypothetical protein AVEN_72745-1 [Araneus ventricosus]|uniref:Uncharacterized protein n=1 Tax=Araneus ventricosus TaxID=182803 RepID=A0A4Y2DQV8_ARAVE|nr:hypothetical protein AVEN_72745-1 [Araneus ventricosus]